MSTWIESERRAPCDETLSDVTSSTAPPPALPTPSASAPSAPPDLSELYKKNSISDIWEKWGRHIWGTGVPGIFYLPHNPQRPAHAAGVRHALQRLRARRHLSKNKRFKTIRTNVRGEKWAGKHGRENMGERHNGRGGVEWALVWRRSPAVASRAVSLRRHAAQSRPAEDKCRLLRNAYGQV